MISASNCYSVSSFFHSFNIYEEIIHRVYISSSISISEDDILSLCYKSALHCSYQFHAISLSAVESKSKHLDISANLVRIFSHNSEPV